MSGRKQIKEDELRILLVNDDGVYAPGIRVLLEELSSLGNVSIVAPLEERSTTGHTLSLGIPVRLEKISTNIYGCSGYPADCTLIGLGGAVSDQKPDIVISGINRGANLAQDQYYSGTVAGAREAVFQGVPAISVSLVTELYPENDHEVGYRQAGAFIRSCLSSGILEVFDDLELVNVNVPCLPKSEIKGVHMGSPGFRHYSNALCERKDPKGKSYYWVGGQYQGFDSSGDSDCHIVDQNAISFSPLNFSNSYVDNKSKWLEFLENLSY